MTDKEKLDAIRAEIHRLVDVRGYDKEMANDLFAFMDSLPNEPVSENFTKALAECIHQAQGSVFDPMVLAETWKDELIKLAKSEEPVSEALWEASKQYALRQVLASTDTEMSEQAYLSLRLFSGFELAVAHKDGAKWQKQQIKKSMDLGEPPYLISVEQAYYRTLKLLED